MSVLQEEGEKPHEAPATEAAQPAVTASPGKRKLHEVVHGWIPLGIAIVSVLAATMGWRASLADQSSALSEELSRQDLVHQQQLIGQDNSAVDADVQTFGQFAQYSLLAHSLLQDANRVGGSVGDQLRIESQADLGIARYLGKQIVYENYAFDPSNPNGNPSLRSDGTYRPGHPYPAALALGLAENGDTALHGLAPEQLHAKAEADHTRGVDLTGIAALFVSVMVLLTLGAIVTGPPKVLLAGSGATVALAGVILFVLVQTT